MQSLVVHQHWIDVSYSPLHCRHLTFFFQTQGSFFHLLLRRRHYFLVRLCSYELFDRDCTDKMRSHIHRQGPVSQTQVDVLLTCSTTTSPTDRHTLSSNTHTHRIPHTRSLKTIQPFFKNFNQPNSERERERERE